MAKQYTESTGLINANQITGSRRTNLNGGTIRFYSGTMPADADAALGSATLIMELTSDGAAFGGANGVNFENASTAGVMQKDPAQDWKTNSITTSGTPTWWRWVKSGDDGLASTTQIRAQGTCGVGINFDINLSQATFTGGTPFALSAYQHQHVKTVFFST
jgi:hypothetical protein